MHRIQLTTFLKLLSLPTHEKTRSYSKYEDAGGYDFYGSLKRVARDVSEGKISSAEALAFIENLSRPPEREHNTTAAKALFNRLAKTKSTPFTPPSGLYVSPSGLLGVKLKPEIGRVVGGKRHVIALWATREPILARGIAGVGVYLLQSELGKGAYADCEFYVFDLVSNKMYRTASNQAQILIAAECATADTFFKTEAA